MTSTSHNTIQIGSHTIGPGHPCMIVAEIAQAHDGSLGTAHAYIDAVAESGATAIKFQTHIAEAESTLDEPFRVKFSPQDATRYDYWKRMEWSEAQWKGLATHAADRGLLFLSSAFSIAAVELLDRIGVPAWKVGAGEVSTLPMLRRMAATGKPVLFSSGMSSFQELDTAIHCVRDAGSPVAVMQCTTAYPCPPEKLGLNVIALLRQRYGCPVGLSDHSGVTHAGLAAATMGANLLEVHAVFSRECFGPDVPASLTTAELRDLVDGVQFIERALAHPVDKDQFADEMADLRQTFGKSIVAARDLEAGLCLAEADLAMKKPGGGIPAGQLDRVIGRILKRLANADTRISEDDLE